MLSIRPCLNVGLSLVLAGTLGLASLKKESLSQQYLLQTPSHEHRDTPHPEQTAWEAFLTGLRHKNSVVSAPAPR